MREVEPEGLYLVGGDGEFETNICRFEGAPLEWLRRQ